MDFLYPMFLSDRQTFHEPSKLLCVDLLNITCVTRPLESPILKSFVQKKKSIAFPKQSFNPISSPSAEQEQSPFLVWIKMKLILYNRCQTVNTKSEICIATCQIYILILVGIQIIQHERITSIAVFNKDGVS